MVGNARFSVWTIAVTASILIASPASATEMVLRQIFQGMCDASAAVAFDSGHFLMFDDEKKDPYIFDVTKNEPGKQIEIKEGLKPISTKEFDFEGAALLGKNTIIGITSHGQKKSEDKKTYVAAPDRRRLFTFSLKGEGDSMDRDGDVLGWPRLVEDFTAKFGAKYNLITAGESPPETKDGLNIEGMAVWDPEHVKPEEKTGVIIGLRGPLFNGNALLIPLLNPEAYIRNADPDFGTPIELSLQSDLQDHVQIHGIRDIALIKGRYLIIGGPTENEGTFALYEWSGKPDDKTVKKLADLNADGAKPEAVLSMDDGATISVLSDDGDYIEGKYKMKCDDLKGANKSKRQFRMFDVPLAQ